MRAIRSRPRSTAPRPEPVPVERRTRTCAGIPCAASGWPTRATGSTAPSCRRPSTTRWPPSRDPEQPDRGARGTVGRRRVREPLSDAHAPRARPAAHDRRHPPGQGGLRGRRVHAGRDARRSARCRSGTSSSCSTCGRSATRSSARATTCSTCFPFENRGVEVGVTLHHPHGQIYAYPFVPPIARARARAAARLLRRARPRPARGPSPRRGARRPAAARLLPGRTWWRSCRCARATRTRSGSRRGAARRRSPISTRDERADFARALKTVLLKYDGLWQRPFPYIMVFHQAPTDGAAAPRGARARRVLSARTACPTG